MPLASADGRSAGPGLSPMQIARHPLFTAREKVEMLEEIRAGISSITLDSGPLGFAPDEIGDAIAEVRLGVENDSSGIALIGL